MITWIKNHPKLVGALATAATAGLGYLGYDPTPIKALLSALGVM